MTDTPESSSLRLYNEYLNLVGAIAIRYADFEKVIDETIWLLANLETNKGMCITSNIISIGTKFKIMLALLHEIDATSDIIKTVKNLADDSEKTAKYRNKFIHSAMHLAIIDDALIPFRRHISADKKLENDLMYYERDKMIKTSHRCTEPKTRAISLNYEICHILNRA